MPVLEGVITRGLFSNSGSWMYGGKGVEMSVASSATAASTSPALSSAFVTDICAVVGSTSASTRTIVLCCRIFVLSVSPSLFLTTALVLSSLIFVPIPISESLELSDVNAV